MIEQSSQKRSLTWLAAKVREADHKTDFMHSLRDICRAIGAKHAGFMMRHVPGVVGDDPFVVDTYGDAWRQHAEDNKYECIDPVRSLGEITIQPIDWAQLPKGRTRLRKFFRDFSEFQLGRQALTASFRGPAGDRSLLTFTSDVTERKWPMVRHDLLAAMDMLHPALHRAVLKTRFNFENVVAIRLTPREKECLVWAAHGHTSKQIGESLGLTAATVNFFIDAAVSKLSASNRAHASAKAVALGMIAPPR
ncbi:MAG: LuxR family transcriptional regulator [Beijerinckiaceae bacterium]